MKKKEFFSLSDLLGLPDLPSTEEEIFELGLKENWAYADRVHEDHQYEFHYSSLPPITQIALGFKINEDDYARARHIGERLRRERERKNMTVEQLAQKLRYSPKLIKAFEGGEHPLTIDFLTQLLLVDFNIRYLLTGLDDALHQKAQQAKRKGWQRRRKEGVGGNVYEYLVSSLPPEVQQALRAHETVQPTSPNNISAQIQQLRQEIHTLKSQVSTPQSPWESLSEQEQTLIRLFRNASEIGKIAILATAHGAEKKAPAQNQVAC